MIHFDICGYFNLVIRDKDTLEVKKETGFFKNLITDFGLNRLGTSGVIGGVAVGTGNAPPTFADTQLQNRIASTSSVQSTVNTVSGAPLYYSSMVRTYRFAEGAAAGNLSEIGILVSNSSPYNLWSRTLIVDSSGVPVTLTVLPDEILDVTYECRLYPILEDISGGPFKLLGIDYNWTIRALDVNTSSAVGLLINGASHAGAPCSAYNGDLAAITAAAPNGAAAGASAVGVKSAYVNNSYKQRITASWSVSQGNGAAGGIKSFILYLIDVVNSPSYQIGFDKIFPKNNTNTLSIVFEFSWGRKNI